VPLRPPIAMRPVARRRTPPRQTGPLAALALLALLGIGGGLGAPAVRAEGRGPGREPVPVAVPEPAPGQVREPVPVAIPKPAPVPVTTPEQAAPPPGPGQSAPTTVSPAGAAPAAGVDHAHSGETHTGTTPDGALDDPTRATPVFEKTFRELSKGCQGGGSGGSGATGGGRPIHAKPPKIAIIGQLTRADRESALTLRIEDQVIHIRRGEEISLPVGGEMFTLRLEAVTDSLVTLKILEPYTDTLYLH